jgi:hypothetical protein
LPDDYHDENEALSLFLPLALAGFIMLALAVEIITEVFQ